MFAGEKIIEIQQQYIFWSDLIPNVVKLMYSIQLNYLRIVGCDCIGSIDAEVFLLLEVSLVKTRSSVFYTH